VPVSGIQTILLDCSSAPDLERRAKSGDGCTKEKSWTGFADLMERYLKPSTSDFKTSYSRSLLTYTPGLNSSDTPRQPVTNCTPAQVGDPQYLDSSPLKVILQHHSGMPGISRSVYRGHSLRIPTEIWLPEHLTNICKHRYISASEGTLSSSFESSRALVIVFCPEILQQP